MIPYHVISQKGTNAVTGKCGKLGEIITMNGNIERNIKNTQNL